MAMPWLWVAAMGLAVHGGVYEEAPVRESATLMGTVRFTGVVPKRERIPVNRDQDVCGAEQPAETLVLGADRGVRGSVVLIDGVTRGKKSQPGIVVSTEGCAFVPHVAAVMVGASARIRNGDAVVHNTRAVTGPPIVAAASASVFNVALPAKEQVIDVGRRITGPGVVRMFCGAHPHMSGWLIVHDTPYFAVTDERGAFRIDDIPAGTYRVTMWHEGFRRKSKDADGRPLYDDPVRVSREMTIAPGETVTLDFQFR
jgi:plastocyanin